MKIKKKKLTKKEERAHIAAAIRRETSPLVPNQETFKGGNQFKKIEFTCQGCGSKTVIETDVKATIKEAREKKMCWKCVKSGKPAPKLESFDKSFWE